MKTYDQIVCDKLKEIQPATMKELAKALDYKTAQAFWYQLKQLVNCEKIIKDTTKKPYKYKVNEGSEQIGNI